MSRPRYAWNGYIREVMRRYPAVTDGELKAVEFAVNETRALEDGKDRMAVIEMVFFKRTHTLQGAAQVVHISYETAKRWTRQFLQLAAKKRGLME